MGSDHINLSTDVRSGLVNERTEESVCALFFQKTMPDYPLVRDAYCAVQYHRGIGN